MERIITKPNVILSKLAREIESSARYARLIKPGSYKFNDGTTQGWKIDQVYETDAEELIQLTPFTDPASGKFCGFSLGNHHNLALAATASPLIVPGATATSLDFYLQSPDLSNSEDWKGIKGYSLDVQRLYFSPCGDIPSLYTIQLQVLFREKISKKIRTFAEQKSGSDDYLFHEVPLYPPLPTILWTADVFTNADLELNALRIRFTQPYSNTPGSGECLPKGSWLVGNISPER